tara:strand:+ start:30 stop:146 length:117 start_codon:yes stop_codon:yes gene_type:complete
MAQDEFKLTLAQLLSQAKAANLTEMVLETLNMRHRLGI